MKIRVYSDIHLDSKLHRTGQFWYPKELENDNETVLVLAGDIASGLVAFEKFEYRMNDGTIININEPWIVTMSRRFKDVIVVLGNHDNWYQFDLMYDAEEIKNAVKNLGLLNVHVLEKDSVMIDGICFIGTTMWTNITDPVYAMPATINRTMTYDGHIKVGRNELASCWNDVHKRCYDFLETELKRCYDNGIPAIVVTHHVPSETLLNTKYAGFKSNQYFFTSAEKLMDEYGPLMWFYGHTHYPNSKMIFDTLCINNAVGYFSETTNYNDAVIDLSL